MNHFDLFIVGQGVAGTLLHYELTKRGKKVLVIDQGHKQAASAVASGLINPITGRKYVKSWMYEELYPQVTATYGDLGMLLGHTFYRDHAIVRTLATIKDENLWYSKSALPSYEKYFVSEVDDSAYRDRIKGAVSFGEVQSGVKVEMKKLILTYRDFLIEQDLLLEEKFNYDHLYQLASDQWQYKKYSCDRIVFCEGWQLRQNPFFEKPGQEPAKGEVLIVKLDGKPFTMSIKKKVFITPLKDDLCWVGSTQEWDFKDSDPTATKKQFLIDSLDAMYNGTYEIVNHLAGVRPTTLDRRPLLGNHADHLSMHVFNGLGTKGASVAPYWAKKMVAYLLDGYTLPDEVNISRFIKSN